MRLLFLIGCVAACTPTAAIGADRIAPGMKLDAVKRTLQSNGYEIGEEYALAMQAIDGHALEFCRVDEDITLVLTYELRTKSVRSLGLIFFPEEQASKTNVLNREALEMRFEGEGVYSVKMRRKADGEKAD